MGFFNENITWAFFVYFGQFAITFVLNCRLFQEFWDCYRFKLAFSIAGGGQSSQRSNIFAGLRWPNVERQRFFGLFYSIRKTNVETATLKTLSLSY